MALLTGGSFKRINTEDIKTRRTSLNQLVDIIQEDISGSTTRRTYQVFVTGGIGPGVTSSLYQTVYDQDFTLQTANPLFDLTVGLNEAGNTVQNAKTNTDTSGKLLFNSQSLMMREKVDIYRQHAANLLGDSSDSFYAPFNNETVANRIDEALFLNFKRLFTRDGLKRETVALKMFRSASLCGQPNGSTVEGFSQLLDSVRAPNLSKTSEYGGSTIFSDINSTTTQQSSFGGAVGNIVNSSVTDEVVGLVFYDRGQVVLDMNKVFSGSQFMSGVIPAMATAGNLAAAGFEMLGGTPSRYAGNPNAKFIPDMVVSASVDTLIDHIASCRFSSGSLTAMTFQNQTNINSTLIFCRATADEFNYSSNPSFTDASNKMVVIDAGQEDTQRTFTFPTTVGLHDQFGNLLAVAKLSRPIEKNDEKDLTFRIRLDF
jgi:hypothetical protein